jgi:hypothetical protein
VRRLSDRASQRQRPGGPTPAGRRPSQP